MLIALSGPEGIASEEQAWLAAHLESCPACREFAENSREAIGALRTVSITAGARLVWTAQLRVRKRALELQRRQERMWIVAVCCAAVTTCTVASTVVLWRGFAWLGEQMQVSRPVWQVSFAVVSLLPAVIAAILLLARGTHLADGNGSLQQ